MGLASSKSPSAVDMSGELATKIKQQIAAEPVIMYSKSGCPYCSVAKRTLEKIEAKYRYEDLTQNPNREAIMDILKEITGGRTYPRVFIGGKFVGGGSEVASLHKSGELKKLIDAASP